MSILEIVSDFISISGLLFVLDSKLMFVSSLMSMF